MLRKNWFLAGIVIMLLVGYFFPTFGVSINPNNVTRDIVIVLVFFATGLTLPTEAIVSGLKEYKLHLYIEIFIFIITPLYFYFTVHLLGTIIPTGARVGIFALAVLPTTITSCVVFTQVSGGNTVLSMFNAVFSNLLGIFLTPLLLSFFLSETGVQLPASELLNVFRSLIIFIIIPIITGQFIKRYIKNIVIKYKKNFGIFGNISILLILLFVFSDVARNPEFNNNLSEMSIIFVYLAFSHIILVLLAISGAKILKVSKINIISIAYVAPQKTLALGAPLLAIYFATQPELLASAILPLLFYHPFQLLTASILKSIPALNGPGLGVETGYK